MRHLKLLTHVVEVARMGSIRKAAEHLNLTPSAMNRRIQDLETEVGTPLFERRPRGVKLTTAGEMFVRYARSQIADAGRMKSHVEDLRGLRRGPVLIACSQALGAGFPGVADREFPEAASQGDVRPEGDGSRPGAGGARGLRRRSCADLSSDDVADAAGHRQRSAAAGGDRSRRPSVCGPEIGRLSECAEYPAALPDRTLSGRQILDEVTARRELRFNVLAESNSFEMLRGLVVRCNMISFQIEIGAPPGDLGMGVVGCPVDTRDVPAADLVLCQLRGRGLSVAAATFAEILAKSLQNIKPRVK